MAREFVTLVWCDRCMAEGVKTEAVVTLTMGVAQGENRPTAHLVELCEPCSQLLEPWVALIMGTTPLAPAPVPATVRQQQGPKRAMCRVAGCGVVITVGGLVPHVWQLHRGAERRTYTAKCPDCSRQFESASLMHSHRRGSHHHSALTDAYEGLTLDPAVEWATELA